jgi:hypothetical protein
MTPQGDKPNGVGGQVAVSYHIRYEKPRPWYGAGHPLVGRGTQG